MRQLKLVNIELKELFKDFNTSETNTEINMKSSNQLDNESNSNDESDTNINIKVVESKKIKTDEVKESKEVKSKVKSTNAKSLKSKVKSISATLDVYYLNYY